MAISDINKAMALYAQPSEFDQNAWKTAFDMADRFAQASEKHRANVENLATQEARINHANWDFMNKERMGNLEYQDNQRKYNNALQTDPSTIAATIAGNQYATTKAGIAQQALQGEHNLTQLLPKYAVNQDGSFRTLQEAYNAAVAAGEKVDPYAFAKAYEAGMAAQNAQRDLGYQLIQDSRRTGVDPVTGRTIYTGGYSPELFDSRANAMIATGLMSKAQIENYRRQLFQSQPAQNMPNTTGVSLLNPNAPFHEQLAAMQSKVVNPYVFGVDYEPKASTTSATTAVSAQPKYDYNQAYSLTEQDAPYIQQVQQALGVTPEFATQLLRGVFVGRRNGLVDPNDLPAQVQRVIDIQKLARNQKQWQQQNQPAIDELMRQFNPMYGTIY